MLMILFNVIAPVLILAVIGYVWARRQLPFDTPAMTLLVTALGAPALIVETLLRVNLDLSVLLEMMLAALLTHVAFVVIGWLILKAAKQPISAFLPSLAFGNTGNMGIPLCLFAFGDHGLALSIGYFTLNSIFLFTLGSQLASGKASLTDLARTPIVYAVPVAILMIVAGIQMPVWIGNTLKLLGGVMIPLMLIALGVSLSRLKITSIRRSVGIALMRIVMGFAVGWAVAWLLGLDGAARGVVVVQSAMPVAMFNYLFAVRYNNRPEEVAGIAVMSTLMSFILLPFILMTVMDF